MQAPTEGAEADLRRVLAYMCTNADFKIAARVRRADAWDMYVDSDHAGDRIINTRSHTGIIIFYNGAPCFWQSRKQPTTALSSAEAEIYALAEAAKAAKLMYYRAEEAGAIVQWPATIQVDNTTGISFQKSTCPNTRLLGTFDLRAEWIQELRDRQTVRTIKVSTEKNVSDLLTKCHPSKRFNVLMRLIHAHGCVAVRGVPPAV